MRAALASLSLLLATVPLAPGCSSEDVLGVPVPDLARDSDGGGAGGTDLSRPGDGGGGDAGTGSDGGGSSTFCEGPVARVRSAAGVVSPTRATSSQLVLNCCGGVVVRLHAEDVLSRRPEIALRKLGGAQPAGDHDLARLGAGIEATLFLSGTLSEATLSGSMRLTVPADPKLPLHAQLCATIHLPNTAFDGVRLYVPDVPVMPYAWQERVTIHLLADPNLTAVDAARLPLGGLVLAASPLIDLNSIAWYEQRTHTMRWDAWTSSAAIGNRVGAVGTRGVPFVLSVDGQRVYLGAFITQVSSQMWEAPAIAIDALLPDGAAIMDSYPPGMPGRDLRGDARLLNALAESGKLLPM